MYKKSEIKKALDVYKKVRSLRGTIKILGYPDRRTLKGWVEEFNTTGSVKEKNGSGRKRKYSEEEKKFAIDYAVSHGCSVTRTCRELGYPSTELLKLWLKDIKSKKRSKTESYAKIFSARYTEDIKKNAVALMREGKRSVISIARELGVSRATLYAWAREYPMPASSKEILTMQEKKETPLPSTDEQSISDCTLKKLEDLENQVKLLVSESEKLQEQVHWLQLQKDALIEAAKILKKDGGVNLDNLSNHDKAYVIDALRKKYKLKELLAIFSMAKSSYCYQCKRCERLEKYEETRKKIKTIFNENHQAYGYRRIWLALRKAGRKISEKVIRDLMKVEGLKVRLQRERKYSSYVGEISPAVPNLIDRDFHAEQPNEKWLTDITEFSIPAGKVYLSPVIDCYDGMPVAWSISTSPSKKLANSMLIKAIQTLENGEKPIIHSDRGGHYRWPAWIELTQKNGLVRSMSKKGCSPDNAACEGFFGQMKNEMFYGRCWLGITIQEFMQEVDNYLHWYREKRIKLSLGGMSPLEFRESHGIGHPSVFEKLNDHNLSCDWDYNIVL